MAGYIDADALMQKLSRMIDYCNTDPKVNGLTALFQVGDAIMDCPTVDAVEVVRCKDCKHYKTDTDYCKEHHKGYCEWDNTVKSQKHFCSYGEKRNAE